MRSCRQHNVPKKAYFFEHGKEQGRRGHDGRRYSTKRRKAVHFVARRDGTYYSEVPGRSSKRA